MDNGKQRFFENIQIIICLKAYETHESKACMKLQALYEYIYESQITDNR